MNAPKSPKGILYSFTPKTDFSTNPMKNENAATPRLIKVISRKRLLKFRSLAIEI
jgi:hypothetical protein